MSRDSESVDKWTDVAFGGSVVFNKVKKPPQYIVFCWQSDTDKQTYETSAVFGPETWLTDENPCRSYLGRGCRLVRQYNFGLSPGGKLTSGSPMSPGVPAFP